MTIEPAKTIQDNFDAIAAAKKVLDREIEGIQAVISALNDDFSQAVELLFASNGHVVISGMGKSGHIGRKIAATLASTGTPAIFVHPGEASHGDLGMITKNDVVVLLSNSGETTELQDIIHYTKRFSIPLIAIVRRSSSMLVDAANIAFILPEIPEASPVGAPTTSTTMMIAWGDALAVALMKRRGFDKQAFNTLHPGGKLGSQLMSVEKLMKKGGDLPLVSPEDSMSDTLIEMTKKSLGCAIVLDKNQSLLGIITDGDLRRHMDNNLTEKTAGDVMTEHPVTVQNNTLAVEALAIMNEHNITSLCVTYDDKKIAGIVHIHDLLRTGVS